MPLRIQKVETLKGLLFIFFISLVLRAVLLRWARDAKLLDKSSIEEILMELAKLRAVKVGRKWRLTEITKKQRTIFEKMEIGIPVEVILKGAEFRIEPSGKIHPDFWAYFMPGALYLIISVLMMAVAIYY